MIHKIQEGIEKLIFATLETISQIFPILASGLKLKLSSIEEVEDWNRGIDVLILNS